MIDDPDVSAEVSDTAKAAQDVDKALGSPMSLLLGPTFKLIGEHWGKKTDAYLNPKQVENLEDKIAIAQEAGPLLLGDDTKPRQIAALMEWTDAAHDVDGAKQPQLSQAWGQALRDIAEQNYVLLDSLSKLNEDDITILKNGGVLSKQQLSKFIKIGLIVEPSSQSLVRKIFEVTFTLFFITSFAAFGLSALLILTKAIFGWPQFINPEEQNMPLGALALIMAFTLIGLCGCVVTAGEFWSKYLKKTRIANMSTVGFDIVSKLDRDAKPKLSFYKKDIAQK